MKRQLSLLSRNLYETMQAAEYSVADGESARDAD